MSLSLVQASSLKKPTKKVNSKARSQDLIKESLYAGLLSPSTCNRHHQSSHICWKISLELHVYLYLPLLLAGCGLNDF